ncbi:MAG: TatD family hydrolase [Clostridia bacterium]
MKLFDTHAHLTDERFNEDRDTLIPKLPGLGIARVIDVACDVRTADATVDLLNRYDFIYGAVGMHPHEAGETTQAHMDDIIRYLAHPKMLALGEIGLDYHYTFSTHEIQRKWFATQLELAIQLNVPVVLHIREAFGECMDILRAHKNGLKGVMHCFSGSVETAFQCLDMGLYIAFGGALTFSNAVKQAETASKIPLDRILLETDCPYMTPVPHRGKRNDPSFIIHTAQKLAQLRGIDADELAQATYNNATALFGLSGDR